MRYIKKLIIFICAAFMITGCGDSRSTENFRAAKISFSWWGNDVRHMYSMEAAQRYGNENNILVDVHYGIWTGFEEKNKVWLRSGTEADVMQINYNWLSQFSSDGDGYYDLYELRDYIDLSGYNKEYLSYGEMNGKLNGIPIAMNTQIVYFNQNIYDKYGIAIPKTWDDYFEVAKVLSKDNIFVIGVPKKHAVIMLYSYYEQLTGKAAFNEDGEFLLDKDDVKVILEFYKKLIDEKVLQPIDDFSRTDFDNGTISGTIIWVSDAGNYCNSLEKAGGTPILSEYPTVNEPLASGKYIKPATLYAISKNTANPIEAAKFLEFLISDPELAKAQGTEKGVPINEKAYSELEASGGLGTYEAQASNKMKEDAEKMTCLYPAMENADTISVFKDNSTKYLYGKEKLDVVAEEICRGINEVLKK